MPKAITEKDRRTFRLLVVVCALLQLALAFGLFVTSSLSSLLWGSLLGLLAVLLVLAFAGWHKRVVRVIGRVLWGVPILVGIVGMLLPVFTGLVTSETALDYVTTFVMVQHPLVLFLLPGIATAAGKGRKFDRVCLYVGAFLNLAMSVFLNAYEYYYLEKLVRTVESVPFNTLYTVVSVLLVLLVFVAYPPRRRVQKGG